MSVCAPVIPNLAEGESARRSEMFRFFVKARMTPRDPRFCSPHSRHSRPWSTVSNTLSARLLSLQIVQLHVSTRDLNVKIRIYNRLCRVLFSVVLRQWRHRRKTHKGVLEQSERVHQNSKCDVTVDSNKLLVRKERLFNCLTRVKNNDILSNNIKKQ